MVAAFEPALPPDSLEQRGFLAILQSQQHQSDALTRASDLTRLEALLGHRFADRALLNAALTHTSLRRQGRVSYERLEFLGDRVLGLIVADLLLHRFPREPEGDLAKRQAALIKRDTLADVGRDLGLGAFLKMSKSEEQSGGRDNPNLLSDTLEALMAALYLDGSLAAAKAFVVPLWSPLVDAAKYPPKDAKTALQERTQALRLGLPRYSLVAQTGPGHNPEFVVQVEVRGRPPAQGGGKSKRVAEQAAARALLQVLG